MKTWIALSLAFFSISGAAADHTPLAIEVPAVKIWCATNSFLPTEATAQQQNEALQSSLGEVIRKEAASKGIVSIGVWFVKSFESTPSKDKDSPASVKLTVCSAVPEDAPAPENDVTESTQPPAKGLAIICPDSDQDACETAMTTALKAPPWNVSDDSVDTLDRRYHPALSTEETAANAIASLESTKDVLLGGPAPEQVPPERFTVIAVFPAEQTAPAH